MSRPKTKEIAAMTKTNGFIQAFHEFRNSVDLTQGGVLPDLDNLVWYLLMGVPRVPADDDSSDHTPMEAIDQRVSILKVVFVEANRDQSDEFLDQGLQRYDEAARTAKAMLQEADAPQSKDGTA